jgi:hypothetical protein
MNRIRIAAVVCAAALLAGCQNQALIGSIAGGECKVFERPKYEVRGVAVYDQRWIDRQVEGGVGACKWPRPEARPAEVDRAPVTARPAAQRTGRLKRIKAAVLPKAWPGTPAAPVVIVPAAVPAPKAAPPCAAVDRLLRRCGGVRKIDGAT